MLLPHQSERPFLTDGGLETVLLFQKRIALPEFAAFTLLKDADGERTLRKYLEDYLAIAKQHDTGFLLGAVTWRASADWGAKLGYTTDELAAVNRHAVSMLSEIRLQHAGEIADISISGCVGPRGDGYKPANRMSIREAEGYHLTQMETFADTEVDLVTAMTMNYLDEAIGIVNAARKTKLPVAISFTVETDGKLPSGDSLSEAIRRIDDETDGYPAYFMINCAHPAHFEHALPEDAACLGRISGIRANASTRSHAELNEAEELDEGNPTELALRFAALKDKLPNLKLFGGCCGTDHRHIAEIAKAVL